MKITKDLIGQVFNSLTIIDVVYVKRNLIICKCICGNSTKPMNYNNVLKGLTKTCGCSKLNNKNGATHAMTYTKEYAAWKNMKYRCYNKKYHQFERYGARGITVSDVWRNAFENFFKDMGFAPSKSHSVNRINNNGNYEPGNARWDIAKTQCRNKSNNHLIEINGEVKCVAEWAEFYNIKSDLIYRRIKEGWDVKKAIFGKSYKST